MLTSKVEYLTESGFKPISNWDYADKIACFNMTTNKVTFEFPQRHIILHPPVAGFTVINLKSSISMKTSIGHRYVYRAFGTREWLFAEAGSLPDNFEVPIYDLTHVRTVALTQATKTTSDYDKHLYGFAVASGAYVIKCSNMIFATGGEND